MSTMRRIAVYGKGGIGKSTISANLSVALARRGHRVLQIGCDPKHDSTRLLLHGKRLQTVLDYMRMTNALDYRLEDILDVGYCRIGCVEAGGPKPGVGCAGRGIISTFELLDQFNLDRTYDTTIYDVLGDVVCGGFAVPIRSEYADTILVVTSGEFMALYAANNILRGIHNYDGDRRRVAGLVFNRRNVEGEDERVVKFAKAVDLPVFAAVPRSDAFTTAERDNVTVMEQGANDEVCTVFEKMALALDGDCRLYPAKPLADEELEEAVLGARPGCAKRPAAAAAGDTASSAEAPSTRIQGARYLSKNIVHGEPLHGCAFNGAVCTATTIADAVVIAHAPKSCAYLSTQTATSAGRRLLFERGSVLPASLAPNLYCTEMGEPEIVFGGMDRLQATVQRHLVDKPSAIVVVSACPAGIIGDDIGRCAALSTCDTPVIPIKADGNMSGDYQQGMFMACTELARGIIRRDVAQVPRTVNVVGEKSVVTGTQDSFRLVEGYLNRMDVSVNCRFLCETDVASLARFCSAELTLPAYTDYTAMTMCRFLADEFGVELYDRGFPIGYDETEQWLRSMGARFDRADVAEAIIAESEDAYRAEIAQLKPYLQGRKLMVVTYNAELDWILKTALDLGMEISLIGVLDYSQDAGFRSNLGIDLPVVEHYDRSRREADVARLRPDVLLSNYFTSAGEGVPVADTIPMCPDVGFDSAIKLARRWAQLLKLDLKGDWREDERLFKEYYAG